MPTPGVPFAFDLLDDPFAVDPYPGLKYWNSEVEGRFDSDKRVKAVCEKFDSTRYYPSAKAIL